MTGTRWFRASLVCSLTIAMSVSILVSCEQDDDTSESAGQNECVYYEMHPCDTIDDTSCIGEHEWGFEFTYECRDFIEDYLDSDDSCERLAGECLNSIYQYGPVANVEGEAEVCMEINPTSCDDAWNDWNDCLALAESEDC
ncbi:MAG: hypothetical protein IT350_15320 [Deltaproteobacteria bacterium]|nr:hypothetical protein [Deltaproteobacteria bacterium]